MPSKPDGPEKIINEVFLPLGCSQGAAPRQEQASSSAICVQGAERGEAEEFNACGYGFNINTSISTALSA